MSHFARTVFQVRSRQLAGPGERRVQPTVAAEWHLDLGCGCQVSGRRPPCLARPIPAAGVLGRTSRGTGWAWRGAARPLTLARAQAVCWHRPGSWDTS